MEEVQPSAMLVEEGSRAGMPESLPKVETKTAPSPREADGSSAGRTDEEMVQEETSPCEVMAVVQKEASAIGGEAAGTISMEVGLQEVPAPLALTGAADPSDGGRASPSSAQTGRDLPARGATQESGDSAAAILILGDEVEDAEW
jgi:hypothetical protein